MTEKTYEMMWDCEYCGEQKLLGVTHRFCANCGAAQNPQRRYFPPDDQKVAVQDHKYVGADLHCPSCTQPQSASVKHCSNCGSPLQGGQAAHRHADQLVGAGGMPIQAQPAPKPKSNTWVFVVVGVVVAIVVGLLVLRFVWKEKTGVEVTGHTWTRTISIERFETVREKSACSSVPSGAKVTKRTKGQKKCVTRKVDKGDGTFTEKQECTEPVEQCDYEIDKWRPSRKVDQKGDIDDEPRWPDPRIKRPGSCRGCEREAGRSEAYTVLFKDTNSGDKEQCSFGSVSEWKSYDVGSQWKAEKYGLGGDLDCASLKK
jgi:hypothetical protein